MDKVLREARKGFEVPEGTRGLEKSGALARGEGRGRRGGNIGAGGLGPIAGGAKRGPKPKGSKGGKGKGKVEEEEGNDGQEWDDDDGDE